MCPFEGPSQCVYKHTNRNKVHVIRLWSITHVNTNLNSHHLKKLMFSKGVPNMVLGSSGLQCWTQNHILPVGCDLMHHKGSPNRAKVVLICKLCFVIHIWPLNSMKFVTKMINNCVCHSIFFVLHDKLGWPHDAHMHPNPFHQSQATVNTICCRMKSTSPVEVC